jgi:hypothetical protein
MFAGSGPGTGAPTSSPRSVSIVGRNINRRVKNGLFSTHNNKKGMFSGDNVN